MWERQFRFHPAKLSGRSMGRKFESCSGSQHFCRRVSHSRTLPRITAPVSCEESPAVAPSALEPPTSLATSRSCPRQHSRLPTIGMKTGWSPRCSVVHRDPAQPCCRCPYFAELRRQRQQYAHVTQQLLWEEYRWRYGITVITPNTPLA